MTLPIPLMISFVVGKIT